GQNEGNIWQNVMNNSVSVTGSAASSRFTGLYVGNAGAGVPYNNSTSGGKFSCNFGSCADHAPLTLNYQAPPSPSPSGSNNGGGGAGSGGSSSQKASELIEVDIGLNRSCTVRVSREISSTENRSTVFNTLTNLGDPPNCVMLDFAFSDILPEQFPPNETEFVPGYASLNGSTATFLFPTFSPNESRSISYSIARFVPPSRLGLFKNATLTARKAAPPAEVRQKPEEPGETTEPLPKPVPPAETVPESELPEEQPQQGSQSAGFSEMDMAVLATVAVLILLGLLLSYLALQKKTSSLPLGAVPSAAFGVSTASLPPAKEGQPFSTILSAKGGKPPYKWEADEMPDWLQLDTDSGRLYGIPPKGSAGVHDVFVCAVDSGGNKSLLNLLYVEVSQ
ncbi:TPA: hypothetical protein HA243_05545, partial [Candidatus Micrarchaeota archaeon]|nr:hypothetical protein [Candidatus Micrarchaeota archaeon]